jgi:transcriptional regulator with XRE-family HTH domain
MPRPSKAKADLKDIGERIRELRGDVSQDEFAPQLGITQGQLSKIERGQAEPSVAVLVKLHERFNKTLDWLVLGRD